MIGLEEVDIKPIHQPLDQLYMLRHIQEQLPKLIGLEAEKELEEQKKVEKHASTKSIIKMI